MDDYDNFLRELKERIRSAQVRAALSVNRELVLLYWQIGRATGNPEEGLRILAKLDALTE